MALPPAVRNVGVTGVHLSFPPRNKLHDARLMMPRVFGHSINVKCVVRVTGSRCR